MSAPLPASPLTLSADMVNRLLQALSSQTDFRTRFRHDPIAALMELGFQLPEAIAPTDPRVEALRASLQVDQLAPKQAIAAASAQLRAQLTGELAMIPIQLNVESTASRRRLK